MRSFEATPDSFTPEPAYNTVARRIFPLDGLEPSAWGGAWVALEPGQTSTPHDHAEQELFLVISGHGVLRHGAEERRVTAGSTLYMEPGTRHSLTNDGDERLVFVSIWWDDPTRQAAGTSTPTGPDGAAA